MPPHFNFAAEIGESLDEPVDGLDLIAPVEVLGAEVVKLDAVAKHEVGGRQHGSCNRDDGLLGTTARPQSVKERLQVAALLAGSSPRGGDESGLQPVGTLAHSCGPSLASALVVAGAEAAQETR